ncbi:MAG: hypothetical protein ACRDGQ_04900 [Candidatus Limnocylindrales bacterium]
MTGHLFARRVATLLLVVALLAAASTMFLATTFGAPDYCVIPQSNLLVLITCP